MIRKIINQMAFDHVHVITYLEIASNFLNYDDNSKLRFQESNQLITNFYWRFSTYQDPNIIGRRNFNTSKSYSRDLSFETR